MFQTKVVDGCGSIFGIAHYNMLDGSGIEPWWGARFFLAMQPDPEAHPASCTMCTGFLSRGKAAWGVELATYPDLASGLKKE